MDRIPEDALKIASKTVNEILSATALTFTSHDAVDIAIIIARAIATERERYAAQMASATRNDRAAFMNQGLNRQFDQP